MAPAAVVTPIAFIVFNRPEQTRRVFAAIAASRPSVLLIVGDGPRPDRPGEAERVAEVRAIATAVDWPCDVRTNFIDHNLGSKYRVASGIDWVFAEVERAIILEDDCLPSPAFFKFADAMLDRYAADRRVYGISASNFSGATEAAGHYYSNYALMWGWATWRDRWADYVLEPPMPYDILRRMWWHRPLVYLNWRNVYAKVTSRRLNSCWDFQWILTYWRNHALAVRPTVNLVQNIGFGPDATHTFNSQGMAANLPAWDGEVCLLAEPCGPVAADAARDAIDERVWAVISARSTLLILFPWLSRLKRWLIP